MVEMLTVVVLLLISFSIFFPGLKYKDNWDKANLLVTIKDIVLTIDRTGNLYEFSFYRENLDSFLSGIFTSKNVVWWSGTEGASKPIITMACNCSDEEIGNLTSWFNNLVVNKRNITMFFVKSKLTEISDQTDGLVIFGYKNLTPYAGYLDDYVSKGKGIVYIADLTDVDEETKKIFGIDLCSKIKTLPSCGWATASNITFITPANASVASYEAWKLFFHFPETIKAKYEQDSVPLDINVQVCLASPVYNGTIRLRGIDYNFWTCNETSRYKLYLDTDGNGKADKVASLGDVFELGDSTFSFSYALDNKTIAIKYQGATVSYGFKYRKPITIDNTKNSNTLTDYQVLVTVDTASLIFAGKMRSDCGDIRFTDSDGVTQLSYWLESGCNTANTKIWVKVPSIQASSTKTIYMYYGNPSATSVSNGTSTFLFFDDFLGTTLDTNKWTIIWNDGYATLTVGNGILSIYDNVARNAWYALSIRSIPSFTSNIAVESRVNYVYSLTYPNSHRWLGLRDISSYPFYNLDGRATQSPNVVASDYLRAAWLSASGYSQFSLTTRVSGTEYSSTFTGTWNSFIRQSIIWTPSSTKIYENGVLKAENTNVPSTSLSVGIELDRGANYGNAGIEVDWVAVRKYSSPEPTTSVGDETTIASIATYTSYNFTDFLKDGGTRIYVTDNNVYRIVAHRGNYSNSIYPVPAATVNPTYKSAWIANFARSGLDNVGDDEKQLLLSLLLYAADKSYKQGSFFKIGYQLPYINVKNDDMYEVYRFYLGLGYPY